ncbi:hypothetical protein HA402_007772 [Bradysia odoriphaga]|nr:hypothetical protein HA402_007772 [Bradysia odoriphaga]
METRGTLFREIHKNTWLKRLTVDNKKITVGSGSKKSDRSWVVFCVHDDCEATLEGYVDMREAGSHIPEWTVNLQTTLHISHALVPSEQEYEFVITLASDVVRFNAASWEIMQEWVDTLRQKLREMKILSPRENLYSKLPEIRAPLLPTRDPTSPLPAPPPVPAAIVPGIERIASASPSSHSTTGGNRTIQPAIPSSTPVSTTTISSPTTQTSTVTTSPSSQVTSCVPSLSSASFSPIPVTAMSNTLTQNLMNMLSNPVSTYSSQLSNIQSSSNSSNGSIDDAFFFEDEPVVTGASQLSDLNFMHEGAAKNRKELFPKVDNLPSLAKTFSDNVLADPNTCASTSTASMQNSADLLLQHDGETSSSSSTPSAVYQDEPLVIPRPQTSRISSRENQLKRLAVQPQILSAIPTTLTDDIGTTNITIIQVSSPISSTKTSKEIFNFPTLNSTIEKADNNFRSNVQIIPSNYSPPPSITTGTNLPVKGKTNITVQVSGATSLATGYGKIIKQGLHRSESQPQSSSSVADISPSVRSFGAVTNIPIGSDEKPTNSMHYEQVFITPSTSTEASEDSRQTSTSKMVVAKQQPKSSSQNELHVNRINLHKETVTNKENNAPSSEELAVASTSTAGTQNIVQSNNAVGSVVATNHNKNNIPNSANKKQPVSSRENLSSPLPAIRKFLTRGLTEACISRQSRKDSGNERRQPVKNDETPAENANSESTNDESHEQRRRSSSTSDARSRPVNNNVNSTATTNETRNRMQPAPQPFRPENTSHSTRLTLREQQVMQLRREMIHPGGVRIQLRRKDCIGSIALIDAFGGVWVGGWKQKEHPMLYNALHIGDQLISIGGINISTSSEASRVIRNAPGLYIELIIRRVPFGRVYAIRREMDGQCLGLIRDGNTATIVDVVPKSLSARYGLPPKAQSCDGLSLTFWVLTEINGRPLNLFFKDNEVKDRLNSVGRDISILVQPSDLVAKLKKQLKSMRSYKEYIVQ